jgi:hypothetical protein
MSTRYDSTHENNENGRRFANHPLNMPRGAGSSSTATAAARGEDEDAVT